MRKIAVKKSFPWRNVGLLLFLIAVMPITVFLTQIQQNTRSHAAAATKMYLVPAPTQTYPSTTVKLDLWIDPGGVNAVNFIKYAVQYTAPLAPAGPPALNTTVFKALEGPLMNNPILGSVTTLSPFLDNNSITVQTIVATFTFTTATAVTSAGDIAKLPITFTAQNSIRSIAPGDSSSENVVVLSNPAILASLPPASTPPPATSVTSPTPGGITLPGNSTGSSGGTAKAPCPAGEVLTDFGCVPNTPLGFAGKFYSIGLGILSGIVVIFIILGGYLILTSRGNADQLKKGRSYLVYTVSGWVLAVLGYVLIEVLTKDILHIPGFS